MDNRQTVDSRRVLAIDFGGTKTSVAVVEETGRVIARKKLPAARGGVRDSAAQVAAAAAEMIAAGCDAAGAAVPGIYDPRRGMAWAPNLWGMDEVPLLEALCATLPVPVRIDSDRSAYVLGESWLGASRGLHDVVFLAVGTGIGAGVLTDGRVLRGAGGIAGAVGWFALDAGAGNFESEAAGPAVARRGGCATAEDVVVRARTGDPAAVSVLDETARWIGMGVANLVSALNPEMVVLGGGLMQAGDLMLEAVRREAARWAQPIAFRQTQIELTQLGEDAGLLGAAKLALGPCE